jgi:NodT family efflux transporter outer membrane factor (OMF) lipoprotein
VAHDDNHEQFPDARPTSPAAEHGHGAINLRFMAQMNQPTLPVISAALLLAATLNAQAASPEPATAVSLPANYSGISADTSTSVVNRSWSEQFRSEELDSLLTECDRGNLDLNAATLRVREALARGQAARSVLWPHLDGSANVAQYAGRSGSTSAHETDSGLLLNASYEIDFWGRNRAALQASDALITLSQADRAALALTTRSAVISAYVNVLALRERIALAQVDLRSAEQALEAVLARQTAGTASVTEVALQRSSVATTRLVIPDLQEQASSALGALAVLVGRDPEGFDIQAQDLSGVAEPELAAGLPSELLKRRPDVASAAAALAAAAADLRGAEAALFPSLSLTLSGGVQNPAVQAAVTTLSGTGAAITLAGQITQTLFDAGRRKAVREEARLRRYELALAYRAAVRNALLDVELALSHRQSLLTQEAERKSSLQQTRLALDAAQSRYRAGSGDFLSLLESERSAHSAQDQDAQYRLARLQSLISLAKALGGGWDARVLSNREP